MKTSTALLPGLASRMLTSYRLIVLLGLLLFPFLSFAQTSNIVPFAECLKIVGNGQFQAIFGYENEGNRDVTVAAKESFITYAGYRAALSLGNDPGRYLSVAPGPADTAGNERKRSSIICRYQNFNLLIINYL
jgi:hypothetical protein